MPSTAVRPIGHEDRLSIVDHLDELRTRLIFCIVAFGVCMAVAYWQNDAILRVVNKPFTEAKAPDRKSNFTKHNNGALAQTARFERNLNAALIANNRAQQRQQDALALLSTADGVSASAVASVTASASALRRATRSIGAVSRSIPDSTPKPITLGVTEPFVTTFTVSAYAALLLALPFILFQLYAFLLPAFSPQERKTAVPFMFMVPVLFVCGVLFGYFVALPRAVDFLLNFNADNFDILVGAQQYYKFSVVLLLVIGLLFQIPVAVLAVTRLGIITPKQLSKNRGYILLGAAVVAAVATPTPDPLTMLITMAPMVVLFELSLLLARITARRAAERPSRWDWDDDEDDDPDDDPDGEDPDSDGGPEGLEQDFEDDVDDVVGSHPVYDAAFEPLHGSVRADAPSGPHPGSDV